MRGRVGSHQVINEHFKLITSSPLHTPFVSTVIAVARYRKESPPVGTNASHQLTKVPNPPQHLTAHTFTIFKCVETKLALCKCTACFVYLLVDVNFDKFHFLFCSFITISSLRTTALRYVLEVEWKLNEKASDS